MQTPKPGEMPVLLLPSLHTVPPAQAHKKNRARFLPVPSLLQISKSSAHKTLLLSSGFQQTCPLLHRDALFSHTFLQGASLPSSQCSPPAELLLVAGCLPLTLPTLLRTVCLVTDSWNIVTAGLLLWA